MKRKRTIWWALLFSLNWPLNRKETELSFFRIIGSLSAFIFWVFLQRHISLDIFHLTGLIKNWIWKLSNSQCGQNNFHSSLSPTAERQDPGCQAWSTHRAQTRRQQVVRNRFQRQVSGGGLNQFLKMCFFLLQRFSFLACVTCSQLGKQIVLSLVWSMGN